VLASEPAAGELVMREDGSMVSRQPTHSDEALSSRAILPTLDVTIVRPEQEREHASVPLAHFNDA
jgi:hypothetical protein